VWLGASVDTDNLDDDTVADLVWSMNARSTSC